MAVDHRDFGSVMPVRAVRLGQVVAGAVVDDRRRSRARPRAPKPGSRISISGAEIAEWSYRLGPARVTQTVLLLAGRRLAILSALFEARAAARRRAWAFGSRVPPSIAAEPLASVPRVSLERAQRRESAQVMPIGLPCSSVRNGARGVSRHTTTRWCSARHRRAGAAGCRCWFPGIPRGIGER